MRENLRNKIRTQEHVCHICGFTTMSKLHIKRHILVKHQSDKHKKCPHCDFHTAYTHGIQTHIDGNHPELYEKNFDCDHCSKRFIFTQSVRKHLDKLQVRKQLACKYCGLQVLKIKELLDHVAEIHPETRQGLLYRWTEHSILPITTRGGFKTLTMLHKLAQSL